MKNSSKAIIAFLATLVLPASMWISTQVTGDEIALSNYLITYFIVGPGLAYSAWLWASK